MVHSKTTSVQANCTGSAAGESCQLSGSLSLLAAAAKFKQQPASETSTIKVAVFETHLFLARSFQIGKDLCEDVNREEDA